MKKFCLSLPDDLANDLAAEADRIGLVSRHALAIAAVAAGLVEIHAHPERLADLLRGLRTSRPASRG